jgi:outer membrane lipoprotein-sorting protein
MLKKALLFALAIPAMMAVKAQTADDIISKHIDAIGGKDKLSKMKSIYYESSVQVMGNEAHSKMYIVNGKGLRLESDPQGQKMVQVFTDKSGWAINPFMGGTDPQALPDDAYKAGRSQIYIGGALLDYASKGYKAEFLGKEDGNYKVKLTGADSIETTYYFDPTTYYEVKSISKGNMMGQDLDITRTNSNFKKTSEGYVYPATVDISYGGQFNVTSTVTKVELNKDIDPTIFDMPGKK